MLKYFKVTGEIDIASGGSLSSVHRHIPRKLSEPQQGILSEPQGYIDIVSMPPTTLYICCTLYLVGGCSHRSHQIITWVIVTGSRVVALLSRVARRRKAVALCEHCSWCGAGPHQRTVSRQQAHTHPRASSPRRLSKYVRPSFQERAPSFFCQPSCAAVLPP